MEVKRAATYWRNRQLLAKKDILQQVIEYISRYRDLALVWASLVRFGLTMRLNFL